MENRQVRLRDGTAQQTPDPRETVRHSRHAPDQRVLLVLRRSRDTVSEVRLGVLADQRGMRVIGDQFGAIGGNGARSAGNESVPTGVESFVTQRRW